LPCESQPPPIPVQEVDHYASTEAYEKNSTNYPQDDGHGDEMGRRSGELGGLQLQEGWSVFLPIKGNEFPG
jgi:hypothetical protein